MVSVESMRRIYKNHNYSDQQLLAIRSFLYRIAEMQSQLD